MTELGVSILSVLASLFYLQTGAYVLWKNPSMALNRWFFVFTCTLAIWSSGLIIHIPREDQFGGFPLFWLSITGAIFLPPVMFKFFSVLTGIPRFRKVGAWWFRIKLLISIGFFLMAIFGEGLIGQRLERGYIEFGTPFFFFGLAYLIFIIASLVVVFQILIRWRIGLRHPSEKTRANIILIALVVSVFLGLLIDLILPQLGLMPNLNIAHFFGIIWVATMAYGILRLRFFSLTLELSSEKILEHSRQIAFFCSTGCKVLKTNEFTANLLQMPKADIIGKPVSAFFSNSKTIEDMLHKAMQDGKLQKIDSNLITIDGNLVEVSVSATIVLDKFEDSLGVIVFGKDNSETVQLRSEIQMRKNAEQQLGIIGVDLENRIIERTEKLSGLHRELQINMTERLNAEEKIKADILEKELLINEIYDRVKRNMELFIFLLDHGGNSSEEPRVANNPLLNALAQRIKTILLVHQNLYLSTTYSQVDFTSFLNSLITEIYKLNPDSSKITLDIQVNDLLIDYKYAIPLGLIINELLNNAFLHAFDFNKRYLGKNSKPLVSLHLAHEDNHYYLVVKDNGKGMQDDIQIPDLTTNGLPLVSILARHQLNGEIRLQSKEGTSVFVTFPED
ncbi:MAG TPA: histidine kinase dimerization/phosphoacceptor domain -containing protein [Bacteroidales bacterium]|nr:histidine kinase dimerization/phosphoacceptor domain -containing protein [Bacteroidales bacterium]